MPACMGLSFIRPCMDPACCCMSSTPYNALSSTHHCNAERLPSAHHPPQPLKQGLHAADVTSHKPAEVHMTMGASTCAYMHMAVNTLTRSTCLAVHKPIPLPKYHAMPGCLCDCGCCKVEDAAISMRLSPKA